MTIIVREDQRIAIVNSHNAWTFRLLLHSLFCMIIYRLGVCRAGGYGFCYTRTNDTWRCCMQQVTHAVSGWGKRWILQCDKWGWVLDVSLWPGIKATKFTMENFNITSPKKAQVVHSAGKVMMIIFLIKKVFCISTQHIKARSLQQCTTKKSCKKWSSI